MPTLILVIVLLFSLVLVYIWDEYRQKKEKDKLKGD